MAAAKSHPIIVKRVKKRRGGGHHGGSWKIAYADFVTAMMAFFLLMWLIGSTAQGDLEGIAEYFRTPLRVALQGGTGSGDSSSVIPGGGEDLTRSTGQVQKSETPSNEQTINLMKARDALKQAELEEFEDLKQKVERAILGDPKLARYREQIRLKITPEGLEILIVDDLSRPMFDTGRDVLRGQTRDILHAIGGLLNGVDNAISLAGHTDAAPYALGERGYSNWELSADRANAARRELVAGGMNESKVLRIVGLSSSLPLDAENPLNPVNRRISMVVLNEEAEQAIRGEAELATVGVQELEQTASGTSSGR
jgi:chemotaxis protein MotB